MVVGRQEGKHVKVASACVIAVRKFRPSGILGEKITSSARLRSRSHALFMVMKSPRSRAPSTTLIDLISVWPSDTLRPVNLTLQLVIHQVLQILYRPRRIKIKLLRKLLRRRSVLVFIHQLQPNPLTSPTKCLNSLHRRALPHPSSPNRFLLLLLTLLIISIHYLKIPTLMRHKNAKLHMRIRSLLRISLFRPKDGRYRSPLPTPFVGWSFSTNMLTSRSYMLPWTKATTPTTMRRILLTNLPYWRNTLSALDVLSRQKLSGCAYMTSGLVQYFTSTLTTELSLPHTVNSLSTCFERLSLLSLLSNMTGIHGNDTHTSPTVLTVVKMSSFSPYFHNSCPLHQLLHLQEARGSL
jgi:hypothetical protein